MIASTATLENELRRVPLASSAELQRALGVSQATLSRMLATLGDRVVRIGRARASRYALVETVGTFGSRWPLFQIDQRGRPTELGVLTALTRDHYLLDGERTLSVLAEGGLALGVFAGLPWYLDDVRPQGFLGRAFARTHAARVGAPDDPKLWSDAHVVAALLTEGHDLPGDLVLGEPMLQRVLASQLKTVDAIPASAREDRYPQLASAVLSGVVVGSSAGGEQPKFTAHIEQADGAHHHVLVKFTDSTDTPARRRWMDLLLAEHHAAEILHDSGIAAARSAIVVGAQRMFLEVERFDRIGAHGRRGCVSLAALDNALYGLRGTWRDMADRLVRDAWITVAVGRTLRTLYWFGQLIANTDMHFGNASLMRTTTRPLDLAPSYDMLPMLYSPGSSGEIVEQHFAPALPPPSSADEWLSAAHAAVACWQRIAGDARVSDGFRAIAQSNAASIQGAIQHQLS